MIHFCSSYHGFVHSKLGYAQWFGFWFDLIFVTAPAASNITLASKMVKSGSKIIIWLLYSKSVIPNRVAAVH